jgi:hypothetical protein
MWNHALLAYEVARCLACGEHVLFVLGAMTVVLSALRHRSRERAHNVVEPLMAKATLLYTTVRAALLFPAPAALRLAVIKAAVLGTWLAEGHAYERIHPWLHVLVAADMHYYLTKFREWHATAPPRLGDN